MGDSSSRRNRSAVWVGALSALVLAASWTLVWRPFLLHIHNILAVVMLGAFLALIGSLYAALRGSRWWYVLVTLSGLLLILGIIDLGG